LDEREAVWQAKEAKEKEVGYSKSQGGMKPFERA